MIVNNVAWLAGGSHFCSITVMVPDSELGNYMFREIGKPYRDPREFVPMILAAKLPPEEKANLLLNVRIKLKDRLDERRANENTRP